MNEQIIESTASYTGFTPWEIVLMAAVTGLFLFLVKQFGESKKLQRECIEAMNNSTNAINNNTTAFKEFKTDVIERLKEK